MNRHDIYERIYQTHVNLGKYTYLKFIQPMGRCGEIREPRWHVRIENGEKMRARSAHVDKEIQNERMRKRRAENPEYFRSMTRAWYYKNHELVLAQHRASSKRKRINDWGKKTGIPAKEIERRLNLGCECCGASEKNIGVDHDHSSGKFRGVLCIRCNGVLGRVRDNPELLEALAMYLRR